MLDLEIPLSLTRPQMQATLALLRAAMKLQPEFASKQIFQDVAEKLRTYLCEQP